MTTLKNWLDPSLFLRHIHVEESILHLEYTQEILTRASLPFTLVSDNGTPQGISAGFPDNLGRGKRHLYLCRNKGTFFKPCPGTTEYNCCGYQIINIGMNCPMDCVYCILQAYLNNPWITAFVNIDDLFMELHTALRGEPDRFFRIGTGEFSDSLALERITGLSEKIAEYIGKYNNAVLELKTKSAAIDSLKTARHNGRTILSWSLNSPEIMINQEVRSASLDERLRAAQKAASWGYRLAFHFDPIIYHKGWREGYRHTIEELFNMVPKDSIVWISMGALRYLPSLKNIAIQRFSHSRIFHQEFIDGLDGKARYFRSMREEMYTHIHSLLEENISADTCLYFCMESDEIWDSVFGFIPETKGGIASMLDKAAIAAIKKF